jgi:hypothetical protein
MEKYRPYFTAEELSEIVLCLKSHPNPRRLTIVRYLEGFMLKINHGIIGVSHTLQPTQAEKLGFHELTLLPVNQSGIPIDHNLTGEAAYQKWLLDPAKAKPKEIAEAMDWMYRNNLMSEAQEKEYESAQLTR